MKQRAIERFMLGEVVKESDLPPFRWEDKTYATDYVAGYDCNYLNGEESFTVKHFVAPKSKSNEPDVWLVELLSGVPQFL